jgi:hypothetical protein
LGDLLLRVGTAERDMSMVVEARSMYGAAVKESDFAGLTIALRRKIASTERILKKGNLA